MKTRFLVLAMPSSMAGSTYVGEIQFTDAPQPTNDINKRSVLRS